jgi:pSer/pThr/pTyr-binding forkhead associated (FHA) protein
MTALSTMPSRLTLTLPPGFGAEETEVYAKRFSIGRTPENDLVLDDSSLSRRHALIENYEGRFYLSDCGSSNGTLINGRQVTSPSELSDWDVLTFGGVGDIVARVREEAVETSDQAGAVSAQSLPYTGARAVVKGAKSVPATDQSWLSLPLIAGGAAVVILLVTVVALIAISTGSNSRVPPINVRRQTPVSVNDNDNNAAGIPSSSPSTSDVNAGGPSPIANGADDLSSIEAYALKVLSGISPDPHPVLNEKSVGAINEQVQRYKGSSTLRDELQTMKRALPQVSSAAKSNGVRIPLAVYATLARIDKDGGRGDPSQVAASLCPALARMRAIFGDELANDSLLSVAGLEEGPGLQGKITKLSGKVSDSVSTIRSIWYLHDHDVINPGTYNFLLRFLAIGVIAQNPQKFGIAAEPFTF